MICCTVIEFTCLIHIISVDRYNVKINSLLQNHIQNVLCKVNHHAAEKGHKALRTLPGIVAFEGKTDLHNAEAQQNSTDYLDKSD